MTQFPTSPPSNRPSMPVAFDGQIYEQVGKYARQAVLFAFENIGGPQALSEWAEDNKSEFFTKLFPKIIAKESEVKHTRDIDALMDVIDGEYIIEDAELVEDATPEIIQEMPNVDPEFDQFDIDDLVEFES